MRPTAELSILDYFVTKANGRTVARAVAKHRLYFSPKTLERMMRRSWVSTPFYATLLTAQTPIRLK
jgi:hypothetical protein